MEMHQRGVRVVYFEAGTRYLIHWVDRDRGRGTAFWRTQCSAGKVLVQLSARSIINVDVSLHGFPKITSNLIVREKPRW
jgi:hypothetical protein